MSGVFIYPETALIDGDDTREGRMAPNCGWFVDSYVNTVWLYSFFGRWYHIFLVVTPHWDPKHPVKTQKAKTKRE